MLGTMKFISEGSDGMQWAIDYDGRVHKKEGSSWKKNPTGVATHIAVLDANNVYVSNMQGDVYKLKGNTYDGTWEKDRHARNVTVLEKSRDGTIEVVNKEGQRYRLVNREWILISSPGEWIYTVKENEWLWDIVRREYGLPERDIKKTVDEIVRMNNLPQGGERIKPGQKLRMPPKR